MKAFIDGGSRGNPGPSAYGIVVFSLDGKSILWETSGRITRATCNQAEYFGLIALLERAAASDWQDIIIHSDSMLLVNQVNGRWRVKATHLQEMHSRAVTLLKKVRATIKWIPREKNEHADRLADQAMEGFEQ